MRRATRAPPRVRRAPAVVRIVAAEDGSEERQLERRAGGQQRTRIVAEVTSGGGRGRTWLPWIPRSDWLMERPGRVWDGRAGIRRRAWLSCWPYSCLCLRPDVLSSLSSPSLSPFPSFPSLRPVRLTTIRRLRLCPLALNRPIHHLTRDLSLLSPQVRHVSQGRARDLGCRSPGLRPGGL